MKNYEKNHERCYRFSRFAGLGHKISKAAIAFILVYAADLQLGWLKGVEELLTACSENDARTAESEVPPR